MGDLTASMVRASFGTSLRSWAGTATAVVRRGSFKP